MFAEPSNELPAIVLAVARVVAVSALPVTSPVTLPVTLPVRLPVTLPVTAPTNEVAVTTPDTLTSDTTRPPAIFAPPLASTMPAKVEIPAMFSELKSLGTALTAVSMVAVVVASSALIPLRVEVTTHSEPL